MLNHPLIRNVAVRATIVILAGTLCAASALTAAEPPNIFIKFETFELLPDGKENRLSAPRLTTRPGTEAMISVEGPGDYFEFKTNPDWQDGKTSRPKTIEPRPPRKKAHPKTDRLFPDNLDMKGFATLPGKPLRIVLLDLNHDDEFWIRLSQTVRDIRFVSVDYARSEPEALLEHKGHPQQLRMTAKAWDGNPQ
jgi:hypothetical protein